MKTLSEVKIKKVFENSLANVRAGKMANVSGEMLKAGYSKSSARALKVKQTKTWQQLLDSTFPDDRLAEVHSELLNSSDQRVKKEALHMAYQLKDKYPASKTKVMQLNAELNDLTGE